MTKDTSTDASRYRDAIRRSRLTIYDPIEIGDPELWIPTPELEALLDWGWRGTSLAGMANRTRSKFAKSRVCELLGYPTPETFKRTQPRFPGQAFDVYVQKSNNLQVWNEGLSSTRRYVLIRPSATGVVTRVKVVTGEALAPLDTTGTLTKKYQARCEPGARTTELVTEKDTERLLPFLGKIDLKDTRPTEYPRAGALLPIPEVFGRLKKLVGRSFCDTGIDQERTRGAALHRLVCEALGYRHYEDDGQFPDIRNQVLEVKLQTSPTIDLGLIRPNSIEPLDVPALKGVQLRHCDVRYAICYGSIKQGQVLLTHLFLTTGEAFFSRFPQFGGKVLNAKIQIPLPSGFFEVQSKDSPDRAIKTLL